MEFEGADLGHNGIHGLVRTMSGSLDQLTQQQQRNGSATGAGDDAQRRSPSEDVSYVICERGSRYMDSTGPIWG